MPVTFDKKRRKYKASIQHEYKKYSSSYFERKEDAEEAFQKLRAEIEKRFHVDLDREPKPYPASIIVNGVTIRIGRYKTQEDADKAYAAKKIEVKEEQKQRELAQEQSHPEHGPGKIPLRNGEGEIVGWTLVSLEDEANARKYRWSLETCESKKYACGCVAGSSTRLHNLIHGKVGESEVVDHINSNGLDNRRDNLRALTRRANAMNRSNQDKTKSASGFFGVLKGKGSQTWTCRVKNIVSTSFQSAMEAAQEFDRVMIRLNGPDAKSNKALANEEREALLMEYAKNGPTHPQIVKDGDYYFIKDAGQTGYQSFQEAFDRYITSCKAKITNEYTKKLEVVRQKHASDAIIRNETGDAIILLRDKDRKVVGEALVDDCFWHEVNLHTWHLDQNGYVSSNTTDLGQIRLHKFVWEKAGNHILSGFVIDHILHGKDNRRNCKLGNLRLNTYSGNSQNKAATTMYKGVSISGKKHSAKITFKGKVYCLGTYNTIEEAAKAYDAKAKEFHGEGASLNFPM